MDRGRGEGGAFAHLQVLVDDLAPEELPVVEVDDDPERAAHLLEEILLDDLAVLAVTLRVELLLELRALLHLGHTLLLQRGEDLVVVEVVVVELVLLLNLGLLLRRLPLGNLVERLLLGGLEKVLVHVADERVLRDVHVHLVEDGAGGGLP